MTFLNPAILFGLIAVGIPLIIHLFNLRRPKTVDFSSLAFLEELRQRTMRRLRLRQWLLLVLRTFAITFLVLAFARPTVESGMIGRVLGPGRTSTAVIIDNSVSMMQRDQHGEYFAQARDRLLSLADDLDSGDELTVVPLIPDPDAGPARLASPALAEEWLHEVQVLSGEARLDRAIRRSLSSLEESRHPNKELFLISDFQHSNFSDSLDVKIPSDVRTYLIPIGTTVQSNVAVTRVDVVSSIIDLDQPVTLRAVVGNYGENDLRNWGVSVYLSDDRVAQANVDLDAGESSPVELVLSPASRGWLPGYVEIEDEGFSFDNRRYFTLHVPEVRRILMVRGEGVNSRYIELALSRKLTKDGSVFDIDPIEESDLSSLTVADYDAVVLNGIRYFSSGQVTALANFVSGGGGLMIFAGGSGPAPDQQALLRALGGGTYQSIEGPGDSGVPVATLDEIDPEHPVFSGVFQQEESSPDVGHPALFRVLNYRPGDGDEHTIISTTAGIPFLQEIRGLEGRVLLAPFVPEPEWTDLPLRGVFAPLLHRSMYYLTSSEGASGEGVISGSESQLRLNAGFGERVAIVSSGGEEWIPEQRGGLQGLLLSIPAAVRDPGVYEITVDGETGSRFAVNGHPAESELARLSLDQATARFDSKGHEVAVLESTDAGLAASAGEGQRAGVEIWNVFLALALVFLVVEMLVAKR